MSADVLDLVDSLSEEELRRQLEDAERRRAALIALIRAKRTGKRGKQRGQREATTNAK